VPAQIDLLDCDNSLHPGIERPVDIGKPAFPKFGYYFVTIEKESFGLGLHRISFCVPINLFDLYARSFYRLSPAICPILKIISYHDIFTISNLFQQHLRITVIASQRFEPESAYRKYYAGVMPGTAMELDIQKSSKPST
jgi:hypothetical protein